MCLKRLGAVFSRCCGVGGVVRIESRVWVFLLRGVGGFLGKRLKRAS